MVVIINNLFEIANKVPRNICLTDDFLGAFCGRVSLIILKEYFGRFYARHQTVASADKFLRHKWRAQRGQVAHMTCMI